MKPFNVNISDEPDAFLSEWRLLENNGTVFQSHYWTRHWYETIGCHHSVKPLIVCVSDDDGPVMLLALCRRQRYGTKIISFADLGVTDYNAPLIRGGRILTADELSTLLEQIYRQLPKFDFFEFDKVPQTIGLRPNPFAELPYLRELPLKAWTIFLPETRGEYDQRIDRKDRKEQGRKRRNLIKAVGEVELVNATTPTEGIQIFDVLLKQRAVRLRRMGRTELMDMPDYFSFYHSLAFSEWGKVMLSALMAGDRYLTTMYALKFNNQYTLIMHAFDHEFDHLSPGIVAFDLMVTHLIENKFEMFDMSVGNTAYKRQFAPTECTMLGGVYTNSLRGHLHVNAANSAEYIRMHPKLAGIKHQVKRLMGRR
jgi:CelD/BcsL family acetyltransferase involved in cellulose biosynthesis